MKDFLKLMLNGAIAISGIALLWMMVGFLWAVFGGGR